MKRLAAIILISIFCAFSASASYISLKTTVNTSVEKDVLKVRVTAVNKGDEGAHNVQAEMRLGKRVILAPKRQELGVDAAYRAAAEFDLKLKAPGQYPMVVIMHYTDANQYSFSALSVPIFIYKEERVGDVFGQLSSARISEKGSIDLLLKNAGEQEVRVSSRLILPRELTAVRGAQEMLLAPRSKKKMRFEVENFSALAGSTYQAYALTEYEKGGFHYCAVSPATLSIVEKNFFRDYRFLIYGLIAALIVAFIFLQFKKK